MAKFSELLGGIAKDLVMLQVSSDQASLDILSHYRDKDVLKYLDIPRFSISDIKLNLKFAINSGVNLEQTNSSVIFAEKEWANLLKTQVFEKFSEFGTKLSEIDQRRLRAEVNKIVKDTPIPNLNLKEAISGNIKDTLIKSKDYSNSILSKLPAELLNKLGDTAKFDIIVSRTIESNLTEKLPSIKKVANSQAALERDLEIIIENESLEKIPESKIHEISISLTPDFIKILNDESK